MSIQDNCEDLLKKKESDISKTQLLLKRYITQKVLITTTVFILITFTDFKNG